MNTHKNIVCLNLVVSVALGFLVWLFFAVYYRHHLHYQEQLQLFLSTSDYFLELAARPGGLSLYLGGYLTQFFYQSSSGAFLLAVLLVVLRLQVLTISFQISYKPIYQLSTCIPSLLFVLLFCDEDMLVSGLTATLLVLTAALFYKGIKPNGIRITYLLLMIPLLYWLAGFAAFLFPVLCLFVEWFALKKMKKRNLGIVTLAAAGLLLITPVASKLLLPQYPVMRFWLAGDYYRFVAHVKPGIIYTLISICIIPLSFRYLPDLKKKKRKLSIHAVQLILLFLLVDWIVGFGANWEKEELMGYDYYVRTKKWTNIIAKANEIPPDSPQTVAALNLALSKQGYLGNYLFYFFQNGSDGLIPNHTADFILPVMISEVYYHIGLINSAQRFAFEGMESIPDYQKSVRCLQRLAETNLINGQYTVAEKYLRLLQNTRFYKAWATEALLYLRDEEKINSHPEWGLLRRYALQKDYLFMNEDKQLLFEALLEQCPENKTASDYLLAQNLLDKDLAAFLKNLKKGLPTMEQGELPQSYQEALAATPGLAGHDPEISPRISDAVRQRYQAYLHAYSTQATPESSLRRNFGDTYWYYLHFKGAL